MQHILTDLLICVVFLPYYRCRRPLLASRHRNAPLLQQAIPLGVPRLRCRRRWLRILAARRRRQTDCYFEREEKCIDREEEEEG